jgi:DNA-binding GntR family transcriptional regulator
MARAQNTATDVADHLRRRISTGELESGTPLRQEALAEALGVSRMPVRDALQKLLAEGLVVVHPNRGSFVASMTAEECAEVFDLREMIEVDALRRAVPRHTDSSRRKLQFIQAELEHAEDTQRWIEGDREFHELLYAPCDRPRTLEIIQMLRDAVQRFYVTQIRHSDHRQGWKKEHRLILKAVAKGDTSSASAALRQHIRETERVVQSRLNELKTKGRQRNVNVSG